MPITGTPQTFGASLSVDDSDALALLSLDGLTIGTKVWNADVGHYFKLTTCVRAVIDAETTDGYDDPTWTFANATFTGHEGDTLVIVPTAPNEAFAREYVIDTVGGADNVDVLDPPDGETTGEFFGSVVLVENALETDVTVAALGVTGAVWRLDTSDTEVETVTATTSNAINNTDPKNPIVLNASTTNAGVMSAADKIAVDGLSSLGKWAITARAFLKSKVPQLTGFDWQKLGQFNLGTILVATGNANAGALEGGSISAPAGSYTVLGGPVFQNLKTHFGFAFDGVIAVTATGESALFGLIDNATTHVTGVQSAFDVDTTHYVLRAAGVNHAGTVVNAGARKTFYVFGNGTNFELWIADADGTNAATWGGTPIAQSGAATEAVGGCILNTVAGAADSARFLYGYVES